jgi:hypothetical protein
MRGSEFGHKDQDRVRGGSYRGLAVDRGRLHNGGDTRSSPLPSMVALGCLDGGDERGEG